VHIRWIALLAAGATAAALSAPAVSADSGRAGTALYAVSLTGSQRSVVTRNVTTTDTSGCKVRHADRDVQTIAFSSERRDQLAVSSRLPLIRFDLRARVSGSFHRQTTSVGLGDDCVSAPTKSNRSCSPVRLRARLALRPQGDRRVRFDGGFARTRDRTRCATTLGVPDWFIVPTESRLERSPARAARIFVGGHFVERTTGEARVTKTTTIDWRLVLTRIG
jgi:hypothetical protein